MADPMHYVIIGSGSAGFGAAMTLRDEDKTCRISMITMDSLPFYNRYDLPQVFRGQHDWRKLLDVPPSRYDELDITLRRCSRVVDVDGERHTISLAHQEVIAYDRLLVCAGGRGYLPENLSEDAHLLHGFGSFEAAMRVYQALPAGGTVVMIGGDMIGIDLALTLLDTGYQVVLVTNPQTFWPHITTAEERQPLLRSLEAKGMRIIENNRPVGVSNGDTGELARTVSMEDGSQVSGNVVMCFCGLSSSVEFMLGADVDIERGILVDTELHTTNKMIWAAGDVCQIWRDQEKAYKFYHGWKNVRTMGELAARNMLGAQEIFDVDMKDRIDVDDAGNIQSTFWIH